MQIHPSNWDALLLQPHITQYRFTVNGSVMAADFIQGVPTIEKPMMLEPVIGRCCTGSLTIDIRQGDSGAIPKAASVAVDCRLSSYDKTITSDWIPQGRFIVTQRSGYGDMVTLTCRDGMILAGKTYLDKKGISTWPASMSDVLDDIARIMGVEIDSRTQIQTGEEYMISTPEEDVLMSEILGKIAAVHGGNFIMTESGTLRLVPFPSTSEPVYDLKQEYKTYTPYSSGDNTISRIILKNAEGQQYTVGDDTGVWITGEFDTATQAMTDKLSGGEYTLLGGTYYLPSGSISSGTAIITDEGLTVDSETGTASTVLNGLLGRKYTPYRLDGAYIDPCIELGDTFAILYRGQVLRLIANTMTINCTTGYTCRVENGIMYDDEEEVVYTTPKERQQERTAARAARNTSRIAREEKRAQEAEGGISSELLKLDNLIKASVTKEYVDGKLENYMLVDDLKSEMGSVFTEGDTTLAATITTLINTLNGEDYSEAHISADVINLEGYVTVDDISAGKTYTGSLSVTGTLGADTVGAGTVQAQTLQLAASNEGDWDTYIPLLVKINGSSTGVWMLGTNATGTEFDITGIGGITNAEIIDGHTLKLTKADASVINFRKATALHTSTVSADGQQKSAGWNSGTYTVIATQTNVVTATDQSETNEVGRTSTTLKTIAVEGTPTQGTVMKKNMNAVLKVLYDNGDPESDGTDTGMTPQTVGIDATPVYNYGWGEARKAVKWPTAGITNAYMDVEVPSDTVDGTPEKKRFHVRSTQNDAYITIEGPNDTWTDYAHVEHNQYNLGRGSVNVTVGQNGDITYTPPTGEQGAHSVQNCGTYNVPIKATGDNDDSDSTTISFDPEAAWSDGYATGVSSGSSSSYTDGQNNTLVVKGTWSNGSITFSTNAPNPVSGSSKTLQILSGSQVGSLNNAGTAIDFAVLEHVGTDNEVRTGATISAAINNKSLSVSGTHSGNGVYALSGTGNVRVGGVNIGLTGSGTLTATEAIRHGTSLVTNGTPTWTGSNGVTINGQTGQNKYQYQLKTSGRVDANGNANEDVYYLNPTQAFTHGFNICYNSIGLSEVSKDLEPGTEITIYPKAKGTYDAAQATNITSKGITIKAKSAPSVSDRYYEGKNSVTLNDPTWSPYTGSGYPGSRTVTVKTSGRTTADGTAAAELQKDIALYLSQEDWSNNKKTVYLRTGNATNGTIYASTEVNAESIYSAGKYSVTVTGASIEANSVVYSGRTARGNMLVRLSNMDDDDPDIRLTGIILDPVYQSGLDGGNDYQTTADFEFDLTDGTDDEWSGYYEDVNVSMVYQQGVHDRTPAVRRTYTYDATGAGDLITIYEMWITILGSDQFRTVQGIAFYPNTPVTVDTSYTNSNVYSKITYNGKTYYVKKVNLTESESTTPSQTKYPGQTGIWTDSSATVSSIVLTRLVHTGFESDIDVYVDPDHETAGNKTSYYVSQSEYGSLVVDANAENYLDLLPDINYYGQHDAGTYSHDLNHKAVFTVTYSNKAAATVVVTFDSYAYEAPPVDTGYYVYNSSGRPIMISRSRYSSSSNDYVYSGILYPRTKVEIIAEDGNVCQISYNGITGWTNKTYYIKYEDYPSSPTNFPGKTGWATLADYGYDYALKVNAANTPLYYYGDTSVIELRMPVNTVVYAMYSPDTLPPSEEFIEVAYRKAEHEIYIGFVMLSAVTESADAGITITINNIYHCSDDYNDVLPTTMVLKDGAQRTIRSEKRSYNSYEDITVSTGINIAEYFTQTKTGCYGFYQLAAVSETELYQKVNFTVEYADGRPSQTYTCEFKSYKKTSSTEFVAGQIVYVYASNGDAVNVRTQPTSPSGTYGKLVPHTPVTVVSGPTSGYYQITYSQTGYNTVTGYMESSYLKGSVQGGTNYNYTGWLKSEPTTITGYSIYNIAHLKIGANKSINITAKARNADRGTTKSSQPKSQSELNSFGSDVGATTVPSGNESAYLSKINGYWASHSEEVYARQLNAVVVVKVTYSSGSPKYYRIAVTSEPI